MSFFPPWTWYNILISAMFAINLPSAYVGQKKASEGPVTWSKFAIGKEHKFPIPARLGMLMKYMPSVMLLGAWISHGHGFGAVEIMVLIHFGKRILEVLFLHSFTGSPIEDALSSSFIGLYYAFTSWLYMRQGTQAYGVLLIASKILFAIGICGNFYHHLLLRRLRTSQQSAELEAKLIPKNSSYKIPRGGLFELTTCPHYLFEILGFWGMALAALSFNAVLNAGGTTALLSGHAVSTTDWYVKKFGDKYPKERRHIIPFVF